MNEKSARIGGSRFLYEPFDVHAVRMDAQERVFDERFVSLDRRLVRIEELLDRMEKRLWMAVSGTAGLITADIVYTFLSK